MSFKKYIYVHFVVLYLQTEHFEATCGVNKEKSIKKEILTCVYQKNKTIFEWRSG